MAICYYGVYAEKHIVIYFKTHLFLLQIIYKRLLVCLVHFNTKIILHRKSKAMKNGPWSLNLKREELGEGQNPAYPVQRKQEK